MFVLEIKIFVVASLKQKSDAMQANMEMSGGLEREQQGEESLPAHFFLATPRVLPVLPVDLVF